MCEPYLSAGLLGCNVYAATAVDIPANDHALVPACEHVGIPDGCYGRIISPSGPTETQGIEVGGGLIDDNFGAVKVLLVNRSSLPVHVKIGTKIAYVVLGKCATTPHTEAGDDIATEYLHRGADNDSSKPWLHPRWRRESR